MQVIIKKETKFEPIESVKLETPMVTEQGLIIEEQPKEMVEEFIFLEKPIEEEEKIDTIKIKEMKKPVQSESVRLDTPLVTEKALVEITEKPENDEQPETSYKIKQKRKSIEEEFITLEKQDEKEDEKVETFKIKPKKSVVEMKIELEQKPDEKEIVEDIKIVKRKKSSSEPKPDEASVKIKKKKSISEAKPEGTEIAEVTN